MDPSDGAVVVAIGRHGSDAALEYAAAEALRHHRGLHLVHVVDGGPADDIDDGEVLAAAVRRATALLDGLAPVTSSLVTGSAADALVDAAREADLVVVGRGPGARHIHPYARSATGGVASRVRAPVLSVPDDWQDSGRSDTVVVGVDDPDGCTDVLAVALVAARERRARLVVLSARWHTPSVAPHDPAWPQRLEDGIARSLDRLDRSDVTVEVHVRHAHAGDALIDASRTAELVVLGRHSSLVPSGSHLGPVARAVLRESACPVLLVAPQVHHGAAVPS